MKLRENYNIWLNTNPSKNIRDIQCTIIAENFAIAFAEWLKNECKDVGTTQELLEKYKKLL